MCHALDNLLSEDIITSYVFPNQNKAWLNYAEKHLEVTIEKYFFDIVNGSNLPETYKLLLISSKAFLEAYFHNHSILISYSQTQTVISTISEISLLVFDLKDDFGMPDQSSNRSTTRNEIHDLSLKNTSKEVLTHSAKEIFTNNTIVSPLGGLHVEGKVRGFLFNHMWYFTMDSYVSLNLSFYTLYFSTPFSKKCPLGSMKITCQQTYFIFCARFSFVNIFCPKCKIVTNITVKSLMKYRISANFSVMDSDIVETQEYLNLLFPNPEWKVWFPKRNIALVNLLFLAAHICRDDRDPDKQNWWPGWSVWWSRIVVT